MNSPKRPSIIDLFCGVGGLTLGAARAGFEVLTAVDNESRVKKAFCLNFPSCNYIEADVANLNALELCNQISTVHGIVGGPPCQGFSRIGRRIPNDIRNNLFDHFFRIVAQVRPWFYLAENVPGILDSQFDGVREKAASWLREYCNLEPFILKASDYGVATSRERVFFIGYLPEYVDSIRSIDFDPPTNVEKVNVEMALRGLARKINPDWRVNKGGWRKLTYRPEGAFWKNVFNNIPNDVGDHNTIYQLERSNKVSGCTGTRHTAAVMNRYKGLAEGAVDKPSRAVRLHQKGFCPTLRSGTNPEHGSYQALRPIHPTEPRVITPREAARLQGFPDWFVFDKTKWHSFRQIGNSVSPILAESILRVIRKRIICREGYYDE